MKKFFVTIVFVLFFAIVLQVRGGSHLGIVYAEEEDLSKDVENIVFETIEDLDLEELEKQYGYLINDGALEGESLKEAVYNLIIGEQQIGIDKLINIVFNGIFSGIESVVKIILSVILVVAVSSLRGVSGDKSKTQVIINYVVMIMILGAVASIIASCLSSSVAVILDIKNIMELVCPILLAMLVAIGGVSSASIYQPTIVVLTGGIIKIVASLLVPAVTLYFILSVLGGLTSSIKLEKFKTFLSSSFKWSVGLVFTIFMGYLTLSGVMASSKDGISIKTAKYALKSYLPIVGGYVSDSYEIFRAGSVLIKNAVGTLGAVILFSIVIIKVVNLIVYNLAFKFASGVTEPFSSKEISSFLSSLSTIFSYLIAAIIIVFMMSFITLIVFISTANLV